MGTITRFEEIEAWQTARELSRLVYQFTKKGTFAHDFGLRDQICWAAASIMSNIAEGFESRTHPLFIEFLGRAKGSSGELRSQAYIALDAEHLTHPQFHQILDLAEKCSRQISRFMSYLLAHTDLRQPREDGEEPASGTLQRCYAPTFEG